MCGIAGYNVSNGWADKYLKPDKVEKVLKEAWFHNIHRGHKAAGFFSIPANGDELMLFKSPGQADQIFEEEIEGKEIFAEPVRVLGAHTREPTLGLGTFSNNANNHPVHYDGCYVTHNGTIYNDDDIKDMFQLSKPDREKLGEVDSVAIAMLLSTCDPYGPLENIARELVELRGGMSIHAVWEKAPGLSLLAVGDVQPMVVAHHASGAMFYGSEVVSVQAMIRACGVKYGEEDGWTYRKLEKGTVIVVENGIPTAWGAFTPKSKHQTFKAAYCFMTRYLPAEGDRGKKLVYSTDDVSDYIHKTSFKSFSMLGTEKVPVYDRADKELLDEVTWPIKGGELSEDAVLVEADLVYRNKGFIHAFFGNVEIVMTSGRIVKDVFNHDAFDNKDRWEKFLKQDETFNKTSVLRMYDFEWEKFFDKLKRTTKVTPFTVIPDYEFLKEADSGKGVVVEFLGQRNGGTGSENSLFTDSEKLWYKPEMRLDWKYYSSTRRDIYQETVTHVYDSELAFLHDPLCPDHKQKLSQHEHPRDCLAVLKSAAYTISCFQDLDLWWFFYSKGDENKGKPQVQYITAKGNSCEDTDHDYIEQEVVRVNNENHYWEIIVSERCYSCGAQRKLDKLPDWFSKLDVSERMYSFYAC